MVLLYFLYYNQTDPVKSLRLGMGIIAIVLLSLIKNISVIFVITIKDAYIKFRTWFHKKINHKGRRRRRLREEAKKRTEEEQKKKEDRDLLRYGIIIDRTDPEIFNSDNMMNIPSATIVTSTQRLSNLVQEIKSKNKGKLIRQGKCQIFI